MALPTTLAQLQPAVDEVPGHARNGRSVPSSGLVRACRPTAMIATTAGWRRSRGSCLSSLRLPLATSETACRAAATAIADQAALGSRSGGRS